MKNLLGMLAFAFVLISSCSEISKEKAPLVSEVNLKVRHIDANHRVQILEDDFHLGDSIYKVRGYFMDGMLLKLVGVLYTTHIERDDYFYFENKKQIFSGHVVVSRDDRLASEYKYYYGKDGSIEEALYWQDKYKTGKQFPHEHFEEFEPNIDSLKESEETRLQFFMDKLDMDGFEIHHLNENREANIVR
ncbi:MAG: hypothetical protein JXR03_15915 [Cyclobacteriaceae bacterium]